MAAPTGCVCEGGGRGEDGGTQGYNNKSRHYFHTTYGKTIEK